MMSILLKQIYNFQFVGLIGLRIIGIMWFKPKDPYTEKV